MKRGLRLYMVGLLLASSVWAALPPVVSLPMDPQAFSPDWKVVDTNSVLALRKVTDEILKQPVLDVYPLPLDARTQRGKSRTLVISHGGMGTSHWYAVEALVRFPHLETSRGNRPQAPMTVMLSTGLSDLGESQVPVYTLEAGVGGYAAGGPKHYSVLGWTGKGNGPTPWTVSGRVVPNINPADISPFSPEMFRLETEAELDRMPRLEETWIPLRIEVWPKVVRMYAHGWLVAEKPADSACRGGVSLEFRRPARLAALNMRPLDPQAAVGFIPVPLDSRCNAAAGLKTEGGELMRGERQIFEIPFALPMTLPFDHVDVSRSIFRYRFGTSYTAHFDPRVTTPEPTRFEPGRIQLTVPSRAYRRAWLLAASEDKPHHVPLVTLRFYKPYTAWSVDAVTRVPYYSDKTAGGEIRPVSVRDREGTLRHLWLVPVELDTAHLVAEFQGHDVIHLELTKEVLPNIGWPDPANYSYQAGGLPSSVHIYGLTLEEAPVWAYGTSGVHGNTFTDPEKPTWQVLVSNQCVHAVTAMVEVVCTTPYGDTADRIRQTVSLASHEAKRVPFAPKIPVFGLHEIVTTVEVDGWKQSRKGTLLRLPAFSRQETPLTSPWGVWDWSGGHLTNPNRDENARLLVAFGAINHYDLRDADRRDKTVENLYEFRKKWGLGADHYRIIGRAMPEWAVKDPIDPAERDSFREEIGQLARKLKDEHPDLQYVNCFAENSVSLRTTHGARAWAFGQPEFELNEIERRRVRQMLETALAGAQGVRKYAPEVKFIFGHCAANFFWPFFRQPEWDWDLFAGFGLDLPQFERMPERQPRATEPSLLYFLKKELEDRGYAHKELIHLESYFPASHELALGHRGQADSIVRTAVLSLALGTTKFMHTWSLHDCADRWGSQHYGCCGLISRHPEYNPKPAAAAFATMTRMLDNARYDRWLETGSPSAFCVRFKAADRWVHAVWTIRGTRPMKLRASSSEVRLERVDENGNTFPVALRDGEGEVALSPTPQWIVARGGTLAAVEVGLPVYSESPGLHRRLLDDFERSAWKTMGAPYPRFASNHWDVVRENVPMRLEAVRSDARTSTVLRVTWAGPYPTNKPCVGFYDVLEPSRPIVIPGKARAVGVFAKGASQWFRVVYELKDAKGETWISCGQKDAWNADDIHSWSYFNHDGWRYMEFPLPANAPGDHYREAGTYSWGCDDDGIVDLPLSLSRVIIEMRTHVLYANEFRPVNDFTVELDDLMAVYHDTDSMTDGPIRLQQAAYHAWRPVIASAVLANPIAELREKGFGEPPVIERIYPPEEMATGDQVYVQIRPVAGAQKYTVYVSAYEDGRGAQAAGQGRNPQNPSTVWVGRLQPAIPMYFFATWTDAEGRESKPSVPRKTVLRDEFPFK